MDLTEKRFNELVRLAVKDREDYKKSKLFHLYFWYKGLEHNLVLKLIDIPAWYPKQKEYLYRRYPLQYVVLERLKGGK